MAHDSLGKPLKSGDRVALTCDVLSVARGESADRVTLLVVDVSGTGARQCPSLLCDSRLVTRIDDAS